MVKAAAFFCKTIEDYDFNFQPGLNKQENPFELATLRFMEKWRKLSIPR